VNDERRPEAPPESSPATASTDVIVSQAGDIPAQIRRRREASYRLPPMADGRRDPLDPCHCSQEQVYLAGGWIEREVRDRRCHPDQLSDWAAEGIRRHDERRERARAYAADPAHAEELAIIRAMLNGEVIP
jgi:hypothetical protein